METLKSLLGDELLLCASPAHLDRSVRSGIPEHLYRRTRLLRLGRFGYLQVGSWWAGLSAETLIVDLNPRNLTGWFLLVARRLARRRSLVWGHLHSRSGPAARSAPLRRFMRSLTDGFVGYTYEQAAAARAERPDQPAWVAPNALYHSADLVGGESPGGPRTDVLYVGRLEDEKRVDFIADAFALHALESDDSRLVLVGSGAAEADLRARCHRLGIEDRTVFTGWVDGVAALRDVYARGFCSVAAGFAGLGLTQSLGFGVPQLVADNQVHSPEIELASLPSAVRWFDGTSVPALAEAMTAARADRDRLPFKHVSDAVAETYSAETMSAGLRDAFQNRSPLDA